ncbi:MAG TPA: methyltransferase domain-containing protein [Candidatus Limnocylindria bacterium]|nr:methyltransferase domain-containing protein [Candidatus Limnocylindria bacterium]
MSSEFTGERLPGTDEEFAVDMARHVAAYRWAMEQADGKTVLDVGCGEGYGTAMLAEVAAQAVGLDRAEAVVAASARYRAPNLAYRSTDLSRLTAVEERFDLVVSFQVIEHVPDPVAFLGGLKHCTAPGGRVLVTTPNRLMSVSENPYHLREWTAPELLALAQPVLPTARMLGMHGSERVLAWERARGEQVQRILRLDPWGIRHRLPGFLVRGIFPKLARLVRRRLAATTPAADIGPGDFHVSEHDLERALDLVLVADL